MYGYESRRIYVENLVRFLRDKGLGAITLDDVTACRTQRVQYKLVQCPECQVVVTKETCKDCGWKRDDVGMPVSVQTINHDHMSLIHMFMSTGVRSFGWSKTILLLMYTNRTRKIIGSGLPHLRSGNG